MSDCTAFSDPVQARERLESGDEAGAKYMNSIGDNVNTCVVLGNCCLPIIVGFLFVVIGIPVIIVIAVSG